MPIESEDISRENARRSIVSKTNINKGELITPTNITYKRPGTGISPLHWDEVIGMQLKKDINEDHILDWKDLEKANE